MFKIGNLRINYPTALAPMAAFTDIAFRKLMNEIGGVGFLVTEMISAEGLRRKQQKTLDMITPFRSNIPQFIQLFGNEPEQFSEAIKYIEDEASYSGVDINMGCPANKVIKKAGGSALLKDPQLVQSIVKEARKSTTLPLTVKVRLGYTKINVLEIVKILDSEGVDAISVHFRTKSDGYGDKAQWEYAPLIREIYRGIFIGNGDIMTANDAREKLKQVDAIMIGRGAVANPLIFSEIEGKKHSGEDLKLILNRLMDIIEEYYEPGFRLPKIKGYARFLLHNRVNSKKFRSRIYSSNSFEETREFLNEINISDFPNFRNWCS
jgi:tRNA-dihydrouridine synthase B